MKGAYVVEETENDDDKDDDKPVTPRDGVPEEARAVLERSLRSRHSPDPRRGSNQTDSGSKTRRQWRDLAKRGRCA